MTPPGRTCGANLSSDGLFIATRPCGVVISGEPIGSGEMQTVTLAVPPRISGP
jgi:hypothetical protein